MYQSEYVLTNERLIRLDELFIDQSEDVLANDRLVKLELLFAAHQHLPKPAGV